MSLRVFDQAFFSFSLEIFFFRRVSVRAANRKQAERRNINDIYALDMTESLEKYFSKIEDSCVLIIEREHIRVRSPIQNNGGKTNKTSITRGLKEY